MSKVELLEPFLEEGIRNTNFFNGRLLTAEALRGEQDANRLHHGQLGQTIGEGIAFGLEVAKKGISSPADASFRMLTVSAGQAVNRCGDVLSLPAPVDVALIRETEVVAEEAGWFAPCEPPQASALLQGKGAYLLLISPASGFDGRVPVSGLRESGTGPACCGRRDVIEGVQFRLVEMKISNLKGGSDAARDQVIQLMERDDYASLSRLRNQLAHLCFGTEGRKNFVVDPFGAGEKAIPPGAVEELRSSQDLTDCDVPLALVYWTRNGIEFIDMWSVRREIAPKPASLAWQVFSGRRLAEAEAVFLQFQEQVEWLTGSGNSQADLSRIEAASWFRYLPAAGVLPVTAGSVVTYMQGCGATTFKTGAKSPAIEAAAFFKGLTCGEAAFVEGAKIGHLLSDSFSYPAIDLDSPDKEMIRQYFVRENIEALVKPSPPQPYLVFTNGHMPYHGNARFDLARWDYSNYAFV